MSGVNPIRRAFRGDWAWVVGGEPPMYAARWPDAEDSLARQDGEPSGWHRRETTTGGYPVMGSSPAERAEAIERVARIKAQAMRDHPFEPMERDARYCGYMGPAVVRGSKEYGSWAMRTECGYPPDCHPEGTDHKSPHLGKEGVQ